MAPQQDFSTDEDRCCHRQFVCQAVFCQKQELVGRRINDENSPILSSKIQIAIGNDG